MLDQVVAEREGEVLFEVASTLEFAEAWEHSDLSKQQIEGV